MLFAAAVLVHMIGLGNRPFHHDESQDAYFSYLFRQSGDYQYNPLLHGPLRFYMTGLMYVLFGDSNFTARLAPVLMALSMIPMCWPLRRLLGRPAAFGAAALFAFGPSYLYFGRFAREDIYVAAITLGLVVAIWCYIDRPRKYHPAIIGALLAASFATKETTFITVFVMGSFFLFSFAIPAWRAELIAALKRAGWEGWGWFFAAFAGLFTAALHDVPDPPRWALGRHLHGPEVLDRPARRRPRRRAVAVLQRRADHDRVAGADPRRDRRGGAVEEAIRTSPRSCSGTSSSR